MHLTSVTTPKGYHFQHLSNDFSLTRCHSHKRNGLYLSTYLTVQEMRKYHVDIHTHTHTHTHTTHNVTAILDAKPQPYFPSVL